MSNSNPQNPGRAGVLRITLVRVATLTAAGLLADESGRLNPLLPHPMEILFTVAVLMLLLVVGVSAFFVVRSNRREQGRAGVRDPE